MSILTVLLINGLTGCALFFSADVHDLRVTGVSTVNLRDHPEVVWLGRERPDLDLLQIRFETSVNLEVISRKNEFTVGNSIFFCKDGLLKFRGGFGQFPYVYTAQGIVEPFSHKKQMQSTAPQGMFEYFIYIDLVRGSRIDVLRQTLPAYDLRNPQGDLCALVDGGNMLGGHFESNIFTIPASMIKAATHGIENPKRR